MKNNTCRNWIDGRASNVEYVSAYCSMEDAQRIRDAKKFESDVKSVFVSVVSTLAGAVAAGVIGGELLELWQL